jgi:putative sterol carrier protein
LKFGGAVTSSIDLSKKQENILQETFKWMDVVIHSAAQNKGLLNVAHKIFSQIYKTAAEYGFTESHQEHYTRAGHSWAQFIHQTVLAVGRSAIAQKFNGEIKTVSSNYIKFKYDTENFVKNYDKLKVKLRESYNRLHLAIRLNKQTLIAKYTNQYNAVVQQFNDFANVFKIDAPFIQDLQKKVVDNENEIKTLKDNCKPFNEARGAATLFKEFIKDPKSQVTFGLVISQMDGMNTLYEKRIAELKAQIGKEKKDHGRANQACVDELDYLTQLQKDRIAAVTRINELLNGVQAPRAEWIATYDALLNVLNRADNWALISISTNNARIRELEAENAATNLKLDQFAKVRPIPNDMGEAVEAIRNWQELDIPGIVNAVHTVWKNKLHPLYVEGFSNYRYEERIKLQQQLTELDEQLVEVQVKKEEIMKNLLNNHSMLIEMMKRKLAAEEKAGFNVIPEKLPTPALTTKREKVLHYAKAVGGFMLDQITNWEEYSKFELPKDEVENCKKDIEKYMPEQFVEILKDEARIRGNMAAVEAKRIKLYGLVSNLAMYTDPVWILERTGTEIYNEVMDSVSSLVSTVENAASK